MLKYRFPLLCVIGLSTVALQAQQQGSSDPAAAASTPPASTAPSPAPPPATAPAASAVPDAASGDSDPGAADPLKRQLSDKERFKQRKDLGQELKGPYKKWVNVDVHWIISDEELKAFKSLSNDEERDNFIENFWLRRNPNPDSPENEFREEHYRRMQYANERFAAGKPGWSTDRGHIYIAFGKPDSEETHPSGGAYQRPIEEGGGETSTFPFETWHYRHIDGVGDNIDIEFVDTCMCGDYHMTMDRSEKDALKYVPGAAPTIYEQEGKAKQSDRFNGGFEQLGDGPMGGASRQSKEFDRLEQFTKLQAPPPVKFKDLEAFLVNHTVLTGPLFPFDVRTDFVKVTDDTILMPLTLQMKTRDITFETKDGVSKGVVNILGRVSTIAGRVVQTFEEPVGVEVPAELLAKSVDVNQVYWKAIPLRPGRYRIDIAIKDVNNPDHIGTWARGIVVPKYDEDKLSASSLILADKMERVPSKEIGAGNFIIGNTKVRPKVSVNNLPASFKRGENLNFWMQVYNLGLDDKTKQNLATVQYQVTDLATSKSVISVVEDSKTLGVNSDQWTLEKSFPLASLTPGKYEIKITVTDNISKQVITPSVPFTVE